MGGTFLITAVQPVGLLVLEERAAFTREGADKVFDFLTRQHEGARVYMGDQQGNVLRQFPDPLD